MESSTRLENLTTVEPNTGCWLWAGAVDPVTGYGQVKHAGKRRLAHRVSYETFVGPIPMGLHMDHLCRQRSCINPKHLEPVTRTENVRRGVRSNGRGTSLKLAEVTTIRALYPSISSAELSHRYGVCVRQIQYIISGRSWR